MTTLLHGTSSHRVKGIMQSGLKASNTGYSRRPPAVYLTDDMRVAKDFAEDRGMCDRRNKEACVPVVCEVDVPDVGKLAPDWASYDSPLKVQFETARAEGADCLNSDYQCLRDFFDYGLDHRGIRRYSLDNPLGFLEVVHSVMYLGDIPAPRVRCRQIPWEKMGWMKPPYSE